MAEAGFWPLLAEHLSVYASGGYLDALLRRNEAIVCRPG